MERKDLEDHVNGISESLLMEGLPSADWVILNYEQVPNRFECLRCGEKFNVNQSGLKLDTFIHLSSAFRLSHMLCEEVEDGGWPRKDRIPTVGSGEDCQC